MQLNGPLTNQEDVVIKGQAVGCNNGVPGGHGGCVEAAERGSPDEASIHCGGGLPEFTHQHLLWQAVPTGQPVYLQHYPSYNLTILQDTHEYLTSNDVGDAQVGLIGVGVLMLRCSPHEKSDEVEEPAAPAMHHEIWVYSCNTGQVQAWVLRSHGTVDWCLTFLQLDMLIAGPVDWCLAFLQLDVFAAGAQDGSVVHQMMPAARKIVWAQASTGMTQRPGLNFYTG